MKHVLALTALAAVGMLVLVAGAQDATAPATQPAGEAAKALKAMKDILDINPTSEDELKKMLGEAVPKVLKAMGEMEKKYPDAEETHEARILGLWASVQQARVAKDPLMAAQVEGLADTVLKSKAPVAAKIQADFYKTSLKVRPIGADLPPAEANVKTINAFADRYKKTDEAATALKGAIQLARMAQDRRLHESLVNRLVKEHPDDKISRLILADRKRQAAGESGDDKSFAAELTKVDGTKLSLPKDLLGKVVVIDFWATWCPPCVREVPHMKKVYAAYKDKGVEFVGISLDRSKEPLMKFIKERDLPWIHTYSGAPRGDPTARKYGIRGIPSIWVVGKDGRIVSRNARGNLEETLDKALAAKPRPEPTTQPAKK